MLVLEELELLNGKKVSLEVQPGQTLCIQGSNGCGKSLLLKAMASLYPTKAKSFLFHQKPVDQIPYQEYRSKIMYCSPNSYFSSEGSVHGYMESPKTFAVYKNKKNFPFEKEVETCLDQLNLKTTSLSHLSSGQKQILSLLRALSLSAEILLLDEITSHLDHEKRSLAEQLLRDWQNKTNGSLVTVSHDKNHASKILEFNDLVVT